MNIERSLESEDFAVTYQSLEIGRLNEVLKENGILNQAVRRNICEAYFFHSGYFIDQSWFEEKSRKVRPIIAFGELDSAHETIQTLHLPSEEMGTMYHEYAHGAVAWVFEDKQEDISEIKTGPE